MTDAERVKSEAQDLAAALDTMCSLVRAGHVIDLAGLDERIGAVSIAIGALPRTQHGVVRPTVVLLLGSIAALHEAIAAQRDSLAQQIKGVSLRHRATAAYGRGGTRGGPTDPVA